MRISPVGNSLGLYKGSLGVGGEAQKPHPRGDFEENLKIFIFYIICSDMFK